jgi:hypothetical protein
LVRGENIEERSDEIFESRALASIKCISIFTLS